MIVFCFSCSSKSVAVAQDGEEKTEEPCIDVRKINLKLPCERKFEPVCGCDEKTYPNKCYAERAGVLSYEPGQCRDQKKNKK